MQTICYKCKLVLTNEKGERVHGATFDSNIEDKPKHTEDITWAMCDKCYKKWLKRQKEDKC